MVISIAREGRLCEHFGGYKTINWTPKVTLTFTFHGSMLVQVWHLPWAWKYYQNELLARYFSTLPVWHEMLDIPTILIKNKTYPSPTCIWIWHLDYCDNNKNKQVSAHSKQVYLYSGGGGGGGVQLRLFPGRQWVVDHICNSSYWGLNCQTKRHVGKAK